MGVDASVGTIEPGMTADLVLVDGRPDETIGARRPFVWSFGTDKFSIRPRSGGAWDFSGSSSTCVVIEPEDKSDSARGVP